MQTKKVQTIVFKIKDGKILCLSLKRSIEDGGFWHVLTGTLEVGEDWEDAMRREITEEIGNQKILDTSSVLKEWVWRKGEEDILIQDYAVIISDSSITLNDEHTQFEWLPLDKAQELLEMESAREMITLSESFLSRHL